MIFQRRAETREAECVESVEHAGDLLGGTAEAIGADGWRVHVGGFAYAGRVGDYVERVGASWRVTSAAAFEAEWMLPPADWGQAGVDMELAFAALADALSALAAADDLPAMKAAIAPILAGAPPILAAMSAVYTTYR